MIYVPLPTGVSPFCEFPDLYLKNKTSFNNEVLNAKTKIDLNCINSSNSSVMYELAKTGDEQTFRKLVNSPNIIMDPNFVPKFIGATTPLQVSASHGHIYFSYAVSSYLQSKTNEFDNSFMNDPGYCCIEKNVINVACSPLVAAAEDTENGEFAFWSISGDSASNFCFLCPPPSKEEIYEISQCQYLDVASSGGSVSNSFISPYVLAVVVVLGLAAVNFDY